MLGNSMLVPQQLAPVFSTAARAVGAARVRQPPVTHVRAARADLRDRAPGLALPQSVIMSEDNKQSIRQLIQLAADRFGMSVPKLRLVLTELDSAAGRVRRNGNWWNIEVDRNLRWELNAMAAIIAHEMAHVFLDYHGIGLASQTDNELLVDTVAALVGFGPLMLEAYQPKRSEIQSYEGRTVHESKIGYLEPESVRWLSDFQRSVWEGRVELCRGYVYLARQDAIRCVVCGLLMRLPHLQSTIVLNCPSCGFRTQVRVGLEPPPNMFQRLLGLLRRFARSLRGRSAAT